ncbi:hypothetical protein GWI33_018842 [Rhynchophorus ferrugineus]|uniref:Uncharacterized protein n=1 Tax=Rhynchophorus ferrugineus TaxID=354439 RepID=A0A834HST4_RHYFE|nr:hypothetical protein GWI33_018842 [Rhynchophorus ferrugineus]
MSTEGGERSGRPKEFVTDENIKKIHKVILNYRKLKLNEIADTLKISTQRVHHIIHEYLDLVPNDYFLLTYLKTMLAGKNFSSNEEVIVETEAYFEAKDKSNYKNGIEKMEAHYNQCIIVDGNYVE